MTNYHHHINVQTGEKTKVAVSPEEETAIEARKISFVAETPMREWMESMARTDRGMPRYLEDHITDGHDGDAGNEFLQVKYDAKIELRATKP